MEGRSDRDREGRRRRIMDRGMDRMALITGRVQTLRDDSLPSSLPSSPSSLMEVHHCHTQSSPAFFFQHHPIQPPDFQVGRNGEQVPFRTSMKGNFGMVEPQLRKCEISSEAIQGGGGPSKELEDKLQPLPAMASVPKASNNSENFLKPFGIYPSLFNAKDINSCIIASENMRALCSIVIAFLVVLSNISLPRTIVKSKSVIASKPLYVLLMTDVAIVIARLTLGKRGVLEKAKEGKETSSQEDGPNWDGAVKVLEYGLVIHQTLRAIFIDCSFYMVIVICGLCLL